jgi:selenocysteine lyase/cysteine desulfurase
MMSLLPEIEQVVGAVLGTYSNVHRGSGHHSLITTQLYDQARNIVLEYLGLGEKSHMVIFCSPRRAALLLSRLAPGNHRCLGSHDLGLPLGIRALAIERKALPQDITFETGGGTARLVGPDWVIWANGPDRFEAGTPSILHSIAFARALQVHSKKSPLQGTVPSQQNHPDDLGHDELDGYSGQALLDKLRWMRIGRDANVPTVNGDKPYINLDNGASTPTFQPIWDAVRWSWRTPRQNHPAMIQQVRSICADILGAPLLSHEIIFTSNTTEAINLVAESLAKEVSPDNESIVLNTFLEHNSNELPWRMTPGLSLVRLDVDPEGFIDLGHLETVLAAYNHQGLHGQKRIKLVTISGASNVLGVYNPITEISRIVHRYGARLLVDAAQWVAHQKVDVEACGIDYLAFSGHKLYAPFGTGVLVAVKELLAFSREELDQIHASGEENIGGIVGLAKALMLLQRIGFDVIQAEEQALTRRALTGLAHHPQVKVYGIKDPTSQRFEQKGGVIVFDLKGMMPHRVARALAEQGGIGVRYGCHCAHLLIKRLLGVPPWAEKLQHLLLTLSSRMSLPGVVRISFGIQNTKEDVDAFLEVLSKLKKSRRSKDMRLRMDHFTHAATQRIYADLK